jgi:flagellar biogenesis protein FliO
MIKIFREEKMSGYLLHFIIYTMAMLGIIVLAIFTYKMTYGTGKFGIHSSLLSVTDSMKLTPKKTLYVVKAGDERFLIASDFDSTTLISKLGENENIEKPVSPVRENRSEQFSSFDGLKSMNEFISGFEQKNEVKKPVMKELARKLQSC